MHSYSGTIVIPDDQNTKSKYKGVWWHKASHMWTGEVVANGVRNRLGYFNSEVEAAIAYNRIAEKVHTARSL